MHSNEVRNLFLNFFKEKQHRLIPSSSLIPHGDPTLLLTTAGMVQFKPYFLGTLTPPSPRLASCQKCFRTTDIDSVGDTKHLTFFEMLGNFSVGDYFKKEAIRWAWDFIHERMKIEVDKLWVTIYLDDDAAFKIWKEIGFPEERILRFGEKDNFWGPAGNAGPCGPCSEIHYDFGFHTGCAEPTCNPGCGCGRFLEVWNLVFTEYNQDQSGKRSKLPRPNIDTGMGLERITAIAQKVKTVYETDLFIPIIEGVGEIAGYKYGNNEDADRAVRIISEHSRGIAFLIADGVLPSNDSRGYILRRLLRRASFFGRKIGLEQPFLSAITDIVVNKMGAKYPELFRSQSFIGELITAEEEKFDVTLDAGLTIVNRMMSAAVNEKRKQIPGEDVFYLYDTYGFLPELTAEIANKNGLLVDFDGFNKEMEDQKERARSKHKFVCDTQNMGNLYEKTKFIGYDHLMVKTKVKQIKEQQSGLDIDHAVKGTEIYIVLDETPFYAEMGGQLSDSGELIGKSGKVAIKNYIKEGEYIVLLGEVTQGTISLNDMVEAKVDIERRMDIARNHTATHLLQAALRNVLGIHVSQRGSLVAGDRLRFDFSHLKEISRDEIAQIEQFVNTQIRDNIIVQTVEMSYDEAIKCGAIALFEEKYGDTVRVIKVGEPPVSMELCGGTHVKATGEIGFFLILSESSIGSGLRRIEAVTGREAERIIRERLSYLDEVCLLTKTVHSDVPQKIASLMDEIKSYTKKLEMVEQQRFNTIAEDILQGKETVNGINVITYRLPAASLQMLRDTGDILKRKLSSAIIVLATVKDNKANLIAMVTPDLVKRGYNSQQIIKEVVGITGGSGGGNNELSQAGIKDITLIDNAFKALKVVLGKVKGKN